MSSVPSMTWWEWLAAFAGVYVAFLLFGFVKPNSTKSTEHDRMSGGGW